jgi:hypothetical protein
MNLAYKHLDSRLRIAELSIPQWIAVLAGVGVAVIWGMYVSPFGPSLTLVSAIYLGALPAGAAILASSTEFDLWLLVRSALAWRRADGRYARGAGDGAHGYALRENADELALRQRRRNAIELDLESLWKEG